MVLVLIENNVNGFENVPGMFEAALILNTIMGGKTRILNPVLMI